MKTKLNFTRRTETGDASPLIQVWQLPGPAIQYFTALAEATDGVGLVRTLDQTRGIIECWIMPDFKSEFDRLIEEVRRHWPMQQLGREFE